MVGAVSILSVALVWAGTHLLGEAFATTADFPAAKWGLGLAMIAAAGLLVGSLITPVDPKAQFDLRRAVPIVALPVIVLAYSYLAMEFHTDWIVFHRLAGWATPYGHSALAFMLGVGAASGMPVSH
jgi:hypothetical protein